MFLIYCYYFWFLQTLVEDCSSSDPDTDYNLACILYKVLNKELNEKLYPSFCSFVKIVLHVIFCSNPLFWLFGSGWVRGVACLYAILTYSEFRFHFFLSQEGVYEEACARFSSAMQKSGYNSGTVGTVGYLYTSAEL